MRSILLLAVFLFGWSSFPCRAQNALTGLSSDQYHLYYRRDRIDIDKDYLDNSTQFERIRKILSQSTRIDSITIYAYASGIYVVKSVNKIGNGGFSCTGGAYKGYFLTFLGIDANMQYIIKGLIILIACAIDMRKYLQKK